MALRQPLKYNYYRGNVQTVAPATTPVSTTELENHLKIPAGDETATLTLMIEAAVDYIERNLGCCLITQTFELYLDDWPMANESWWDGVRQAHINILYANGKAADIEIPRWPLASISSMTVDSASVTVTDFFIVDTKQEYGRLVLKQGETYPTLSNETANGIKIEYVAGYGANATDVPSLLRLAVLQMAAYMFEHRGDGCDAHMAFDKSGAKGLCSQYKVGRL